MNHLVNILFLTQVAIVGILYLSTSFYGIRNALEDKDDFFHSFNLGRGLASLGVVLMNISILTAELSGDDIPIAAEIAIQAAQILFLFGWAYSVRITLRKGHRAGW